MKTISKSSKKSNSVLDVKERDLSKTLTQDLQTQDIPIIYQSGISVTDAQTLESEVRGTETDITITRHPTFTKMFPPRNFSADIGPKIKMMSKISLPTPSFQSNVTIADAKIESIKSLKTAKDLMKKKQSKKMAPIVEDMDVNSESQIFDPNNLR